MPITRKKGKEIQDSGEGFYISTDPSPLSQKNVKERLIPDDDKEEYKSDVEKRRTESQNEQPSDENSNTATFDILPDDTIESNSNSDLETSFSSHGKGMDSKQPFPDKNRSLDLGENKPKENKRKRKVEYSEAVEKSLEQFLFGKSTAKQSTKHKIGCDSSSDVTSSSDEDENISEKAQSRKLLHTYAALKEKVPNNDTSSDDEDSGDSGNLSEGSNKAFNGLNSNRANIDKGKPTPAWHDNDDDELQVKDVTDTFTKAKGKHGGKDLSAENYAQSLRRKFKALKDIPKWADLESRLKEEEEEDSDDEFFRETTDMLESGKQISLAKGFLEYRKLKDMNEETHNEGTVIRAAEFHPSASVGLVAGLNGTASLFQIDGKSNPKMQTVNFENFPIKTAHFTSDGKQFIVGSQHFGHFFMYDMMAGKTIRVPWKQDGEGSVQKFEVSPVGDIIAFHGRFGNIHIYSERTRTNIFTLKMNDEITSCSFSPDGDLLYSHGTGGEVYVWDIRAQDCLHRFWDDGCVEGTAIAVSRNNRYVATGSNSGVVNIYNRSQIINNTKPTPEKIVLNLTTTISKIKFNPTSEILAMASEVKENAVKMLHLPSMTVFQNFPPINYNLRRPNCMDFSTNGGYFSLGNNRGAANLFRLKYFGNY